MRRGHAGVTISSAGVRSCNVAFFSTDNPACRGVTNRPGIPAAGDDAGNAITLSSRLVEKDRPPTPVN